MKSAGLGLTLRYNRGHRVVSRRGRAGTLLEEPVLRSNFSKAEQLAVWRRDAWHCRYCLAPVFFSPALKALEELSPGHGYYHRNAKTGSMLPLLQWGWASVDHIVPVAAGGTNEPGNLVTACWRCNLSKRDSPPELARPVLALTPDIVALHWDGLSSVYAKLANRKDEWCRLINEPMHCASPMETDRSSPDR